MLYFLGKPTIVAPAVPTSAQGVAKTGVAWLRAGWDLNFQTIYENGGLDVSLGVLRVRAFAYLFLGLLPVMVGVACGYAFAGETSAAGW